VGARASGRSAQDVAPHALYTTLAFLPGEPRIEHIGRQPDRTHADRELRLALAGSHATAGIALSLRLRPEQFVIDVHGTRGTARVDLLNMLVHRHRLGRGPRPIARAGLIGHHAVSQLGQTAAHGPGVLTGRIRTYGDVSGLVRSFYASLDRAAAFEVMPHHGRRVVDLLRRIWPLPQREAAAAPRESVDGTEHDALAEESG
jgi:predicted dehydrogenase